MSKMTGSSLTIWANFNFSPFLESVLVGVTLPDPLFVFVALTDPVFGDFVVSFRGTTGTVKKRLQFRI